ncbi:MAG: hypothetical protein L3K09_07550 [Thermoplasmata archaeon]|nr:hypothetical protein [Thermoplasmata archaeon]
MSEPKENPILRELAQAIERSKVPVREIEVGIPLSIALGQSRPAVSCGGCTTPLEFMGIPARTNTRLREPFRLILSETASA